MGPDSPWCVRQFRRPFQKSNASNWSCRMYTVDACSPCTAGSKWRYDRRAGLLCQCSDWEKLADSRVRSSTTAEIMTRASAAGFLRQPWEPVSEPVSCIGWGDMPENHSKAESYVWSFLKPRTILKIPSNLATSLTATTPSTFGPLLPSPAFIGMKLTAAG